MLRAILSIGTNSTRVVVASWTPGGVVVRYAASIGTRIGEGLRATGHLGIQGMERTMEALRTHCAAMLAWHPQSVTVVATSALRRADNADVFARMVHQSTGCTLRILSGEQEAHAAYRGALSVLPGDAFASSLVGVIDSGGGSTEYAVGRGLCPEYLLSCEIGAVRLTERFPELGGKGDPIQDSRIRAARDVAREQLAGIAGFPRVDQVLFVGGSATSIAALISGNAAPVTSATLLRSDVAAAIGSLKARSLAQRLELPGIRPQRADILLAGALILDTAFDLLAQDQAITTSADLPLGVLLLDAEESWPLVAQEPQREGRGMQDHEIQAQIDVFVEEKNTLLEHDDAHPMSDEARLRVEWIEVELDRLWDLIRQRRARREFGQDPESATLRPADIVENYVE